MTVKNNRNSSIELLRIIFELGIIVLHLNNSTIGGGLLLVQQESLNFYFLYLLESFFVCAVDLFIIISAYYLSSTQERKLSKVLELLIQVIVFNLCFLFASVFLNADRRFNIFNLIGQLFPSNYFVILYCVLYIISPYINFLLDKLDKKQNQILLIIIFAIFSIYSYGVDILSCFGVSQQISSISISGSQSGYTIVNFMLLYFVGAYIKKYGLNLPNTKIISFYIVILLVVFTISMFPYIGNTAFNYNSPFVIVMAILLFVLFSRKEFKNELINELSKGSFTCFLFHGNFVKFLYSITGRVVNTNIVFIIVYYLIVCVVLFLISYVIYRVYDFIVSRTIRPILLKLDSINIYKLY